MKSKKRGVGAMWTGLILMILTFYPALIQKNVPSIIVHIAAWIMFVCGAVIRGKQKKDQRQDEEAMYSWAKAQNAQPPEVVKSALPSVTSAPVAPQPAPAAVPQSAPQNNPLLDRCNALAKENAELRSRCEQLEKKNVPTRAAWETEAEKRSVIKLAAALEEAKEIIRTQKERIERLESVVVEQNFTLKAAAAQEPEASLAVQAEPETAEVAPVRSAAQLPSAYVVFDIETTGLFPSANEIIEIGAIKYCGGAEPAIFHSFVKPVGSIPAQITELTGISSADVAGAPGAAAVLPEFQSFIEGLPLVAHNAPFDVRFLSTALQQCSAPALDNLVYDTLRLAAKAFPGLPSYQLSELQKTLELGDEAPHRALADVRMTAALFERCAAALPECPPRPALEIRAAGAPAPGRPRFEAVDAESIRPTVSSIDPAHPLFQKRIVFTGSFSRPVADMIQIAVNCGALAQERVTMKTDYLVVGRQDLSVVGPDGKSTKMKKAERYKAEGKALIVTLDEEEFLTLAEAKVGI